MAGAAGVNNMTSRSTEVFTVPIVFFVIATVFVFLRMLSRAWVVRKISLDDYVMLLAWIITFGLIVTICYGATHGLGRHEDDVPEAWQEPLRKSQYIFSVLYQPALMAEKSSILIFFLTLAKSNKTFRWATIATFAVVNCVGFALTLFTVFQCKRPADAWDYPVPANADCTDVVTIYLSSSPVNIITDLAILLLPMPILTSMRLPKKQKIILIITFSFGVFVAVVDVVRVAYLESAAIYRLSEVSSSTDDGSDQDETDFSWYASLSFMWTTIEVSVGIMCACVPGLKPLVARYAPRLIHSNSTRTSSVQSGLTADMVERQRIPDLGSGQEVQFRDFAFSRGSDEPAQARQRTSLQTRNSTARGVQQGAELDMMQFLTTPDMAGPASPSADAPHRLGRSDTLVTNFSATSQPGSPTFFDFVNMQGKKSMVQLTNRESVFPIAMVTLLFFIWGFEYGLLDVLNQQFQAVANMTTGQSVALHSAYYIGYGLGPISIGRLVLNRWGFKACYSVGLGIYACGTLIFWVAAVLTSFPAYVVVNVIVGAGLSVLETGANPFISLCGPQQYSEVRLNLSQGFQAIGTVIAPIIAAKGFTKYTDNAPSLINTQWAYLGIALFTIIIAFAYHYVPLPEATDAELEDAAERFDHAHYAKVGNVRVIWITLAVGVFSMFCYVGAQEVNATEFDYYLALVRPGSNAVDYMAYAHTAFAVSRFTAAGLGLFIKPRVLLLVFYLGSILFSALATSYGGDTGVALLTMAFFFEGPLFSLIYAQSLRGLGKHTKNGSALITAAISGGAAFPALSYLAASRVNAKYSLCVAVAAYAAGLVLPMATNGRQELRRLVDPVWPRPDSSSGPGAEKSGMKAGKPGERRDTENEHRNPSVANGQGRGLGIFGVGRGKDSRKDISESSDGSAEFKERRASVDSGAAPEAVG